MASIKIYSKEQTDALLAGKADSSAIPEVPSVVQSTGTSATAVMSQKAVTEALNSSGTAVPTTVVTDTFNADWLNARMVITAINRGVKIQITDPFRILIIGSEYASAI